MTKRRRKPYRDYTVLLHFYAKSWGFPPPVAEHPFAKHSTFGRLFRLDFAWPAYKIGAEIDGGLFMPSGHQRGGHSSPLGIKRDMTKHNIALALGWQVYRFMPEQLGQPESLQFLRDALEAKRIQSNQPPGEHICSR